MRGGAVSHLYLAWIADLGRSEPRHASVLARRLGVPGGVVRNWTYGSWYPTFRLAAALARELKVPLERVAYACRRAEERRKAREAVEQAVLAAPMSEPDGR